MYYYICVCVGGGRRGQAKRHILGFTHLCMYSSVLREQAAITIYDQLIETGVLEFDNHTKP